MDWTPPHRAPATLSPPALEEQGRVISPGPHRCLASHGRHVPERAGTLSLCGWHPLQTEQRGHRRPAKPLQPESPDSLEREKAGSPGLPDIFTLFKYVQTLNWWRTGQPGVLHGVHGIAVGQNLSSWTELNWNFLWILCIIYQQNYKIKFKWTSVIQNDWWLK